MRFFSCVLVAVLVCLVGMSRFLYTLPDECWYKYFMIPFADLLNIAVAGFVVYFFVEYKNDRRATKQYLYNLCERIIERVSNPRMYSINSKDDIAFVRVEQRIIFNEIDILLKEAEIFGYKNDADYVRSHMAKYWSLVSDNLNNLDSLKKIQSDLSNELACMINKTETISLILYK